MVSLQTLFFRQDVSFIVRFYMIFFPSVWPVTDSSPKNENYVTIVSPSCHSKPRLSLIFKTQDSFNET